MSEPSEYFKKMVPEAWNRRLQEQLDCGPEGAELLEKMRTANFSLAILVPDAGSYQLLVRNGEMTTASIAEPDVLLSMQMGTSDCGKLEASVGSSPMALLGGVGGTPDFVLTPSRLEVFKEIEGTMRVQVTGDDAWGVTIHFGAPPVPDPLTTISIPEEEFQQLISGELDLQGAFMTGKLEMEGDVEVPMKMAMAIMAPE
ncbi:MAG: SCP2 sterol-binding domain-containing protein [bacterium]|nr:SCP2 sterol-binding domain-containing protein [bacterium]